MLREVLARLVVPAHRVHPSSRLPLTVQHLLEFLLPGSSVSHSYTGSWLQFTPLVPPTHLIPVSCLLVLLSPGCTAVRAATAPVGALHGPMLLLLSPGPVCARTLQSFSLPPS